MLLSLIHILKGDPKVSIVVLDPPDMSSLGRFARALSRVERYRNIEILILLDAPKKNKLILNFIKEHRQTLIKVVYCTSACNKFVTFTSLAEKLDSEDVYKRQEDYNVKWTCAVGKNMQRKFSITGTEELLGEYPLIFTIFDDNGTQVATTSTTLKIVEDLGEQEKSFSLLTIGDSLSCNTATYEELNTLTDNQIVYMGTRGVGGSLTEARRGFSAANYLTDSPYTCLLYTSRCV